MSIYRGSGGAGTTADTAALDEVTTNAQEADQSATEAAASASSAAASANAASTSASNAGTSETNAASSATASATSATQSATSATASAASATAAAASESVTAANAAAALASEQAAAASESAAATSETNAQTAQTAAETAQAAAETAQAATENLFDQFGDQYLGSKATDPTTDNDGDPLTEGDVYWNSTDNVLKFYSGTAWVAPEDIATTAATNAANSATAAASSASSASSSATAASTSETNAAASETAAATSATNAAGSEASVAADAASASGSATAAANSASAASTSASQASTSASNAATSESNAASSASSASSSASAASISATSAANSAAAAAASLDNFDDRYLGAYATNPTTDNDGDPLITGALYFNTTDTVMKIWDGSSWIAAASAQLAAFEKFFYTATAGQTVFSGADDAARTLALTPNTEIVILNGIVLEQGVDYTATASSITLTTGAALNDELNVFAFGSFSVADTVSASTGGTFQSNVTVVGNVDAQTFTQDGSPLEAGAKEGIFWENSQTVSSNYTITAGKNAGTFGPVTIADGVTVQIPDGSTWTVI